MMQEGAKEEYSTIKKRSITFENAVPEFFKKVTKSILETGCNLSMSYSQE